MSRELELQQEREWGLLYDRIARLLSQLGREDAFGEGDYWLVDDNWGLHQHKVEIQNLELIGAEVVARLQALLADCPGWEIVVSVLPRDLNLNWPAMGLIVRDREIVDGLRREYFPPAFQSVRYVSGRPSGPFPRL